jgi:hypothetical protein
MVIYLPYSLLLLLTLFYLYSLPSFIPFSLASLSAVSGSRCHFASVHKHIYTCRMLSGHEMLFHISTHATL